MSQIALSRFVTRACRVAGVDGEIGVLIAGDREIRDLNRRFRKKDKPTDVISFPSEMEGVAGDIAISLDIASRNGRALGHGTVAELKILILHGLLHLAGMNHETDDGQMARRERRLRRQLGLPDGLIERSGAGNVSPKPRGQKTR